MRVLVGGTGRCGTSIIGKFFVDHPDIACFGETRLTADRSGIMDYISGVGSYEDTRDVLEHRFVPVWVKRLSSVYDNLDQLYTPEYIHHIVYKSFPDNLANIYMDTRTVRQINARTFLDLFFTPLMSFLNTSSWAEKTPLTVVNAHMWHSLYPRLKYIHAIRYPPDVCASLITMDWGPKTVSDFINYYTGVMEQAEQARRYVPDSLYMVMELESIVDFPTLSIKKILRFCELDTYYVGSLLPLVSSELAHIGRHKDDLTKEETGRIMDACGKLYESFGGSYG